MYEHHFPKFKKTYFDRFLIFTDCSFFQGWLRIKTSKMIDDFTDVNSGEKDFMKMWNLHIQHYTFVGDCQMPQVIEYFKSPRK